MAFVVEDGTVVADANSLCDVEFADEYFSDRAVVAWTGSDSIKESALIRATDYIETRFGLRFKGSIADEEQTLSWPRLYVDADDIVPTAIKKATAEYALRALTAELAPDPDIDSSGRAIASKSEKVGPISETTTYATSFGLVPFLFKPYPAADALLNAYLKYSSGVIRD
jgi:hypothetical protein